MSSKKIKRKNKKSEAKERTTIKEKFVEVLELPKEIVLNLPKFTMVGNKDIIIENYKGIIEYDVSRIRINTGIGIVRMTGEGMIIKEITSEDIMVSGEITSIEFLR